MSSPVEHGPDCTCWGCMRHRWDERQVEKAQRRAKRPATSSVWTLLGVVLLLIAIYYGLHMWWVDTHCTMFLGSRVCQ